jgi:hypothetical protein
MDSNPHDPPRDHPQTLPRDRQPHQDAEYTYTVNSKGSVTPTDTIHCAVSDTFVLQGDWKGNIYAYKDGNDRTFEVFGVQALVVGPEYAIAPTAPLNQKFCIAKSSAYCGSYDGHGADISVGHIKVGSTLPAGDGE